MTATVRTAEEAQWLAAAIGGDDEAFGRLVEAFQGPVFNLCYRMLDDPAEAEDAAQEAFLKAYRNLSRYDPERRFVTWLLSITSNHCVDRLRRRRLRWVSLNTMANRERIADPAEPLEGRLSQAESDQAVRRLLDGLSPTDRAAVILCYWNDLSYADIAETLSLSQSAVKSRLHRARNELADAWQARQQEAPWAEGRTDEAPTLQ